MLNFFVFIHSLMLTNCKVQNSKNAILCLRCLATRLYCTVKWKVPLQRFLPKCRSITGKQLQRLQLSLRRPAVGRGSALHTNTVFIPN